MIEVAGKKDQGLSEQTTTSTEAIFKGKDKSSYANTDEVKT